MGFVKTVPKEFDEAAYIDGCSNSKIFFIILIPLIRALWEYSLSVQHGTSI